MPAYLIANIELHEVPRYADYVANVPALIERHGGRYLVRGGGARVLEGDAVPARMVVLEFPDREAALAFYEDPDYAPYRRLRQSIATTSLVLVDGVD